MKLRRNRPDATPSNPYPLAAWYLVLVLFISSCTKSDTVEFDIPSGIAAETFLEFARQAEVEIIFDPEIVRDIQTHSVSGTMIPTEALEIMIQGTGLYIQKDAFSDAIAIRKIPIS